MKYVPNDNIYEIIEQNGNNVTLSNGTNQIIVTRQELAQNYTILKEHKKPHYEKKESKI